MGRRPVWLCFLTCSRFAVRSIDAGAKHPRLSLPTCLRKLRRGKQGSGYRTGYRTLIKPAFCQPANLVRHSEGRESAFRRGRA